MNVQVDASDISLIILKYLVEKNYVQSVRSFFHEEELLQEVLPPKYFPKVNQTDEDVISQLAKFTSFLGNLGNLQDVIVDYIGARELVKVMVSKSVIEWKVLPTESVNLIDGLCTNLKVLGKCIEALKSTPSATKLALPPLPDPSQLSSLPVLSTGTNTDELFHILPIQPETKDQMSQTEDVESQSQEIELPSTSSFPFNLFNDVSQQSSISQHEVYVEHQQVIPSAIMNNLLTNTQLQEKIADNINQRENPQFTILSPDEVEQLFFEIMKNGEGATTNMDHLPTDSNMISTETTSFSNLLTIANDFQTSSLDVLEMLSTPVKVIPADALTFKLPSARKTPTRMREKPVVLPSLPVATRWQSLGRRSIAPKIPAGAREVPSTSRIPPQLPFMLPPAMIKTPNKRKARLTTPVKITPEKAKENSFFHLVTPVKTPIKIKDHVNFTNAIVPSTSALVTKTIDIDTFTSQLGLSSSRIIEVTPTDEIERVALQVPTSEASCLSKLSLLFPDTPEPKANECEANNESMKTPAPSTKQNLLDLLSREKNVTPLLARLISSASRIRSHSEMIEIEKKSRSTPRKKHVRSLNFGTPKPKCKQLNLNLSTVEEEIQERKRRLSLPLVVSPPLAKRTKLNKPSPPPDKMTEQRILSPPPAKKTEKTKLTLQPAKRTEKSKISLPPVKKTEKSKISPPPAKRCEKRNVSPAQVKKTEKRKSSPPRTEKRNSPPPAKRAEKRKANPPRIEKRDGPAPDKRTEKRKISPSPVNRTEKSKFSPPSANRAQKSNLSKNGPSPPKRRSSSDGKKHSSTLLSQIFGSPISSSGSSAESPPNKNKSHRRITPLRILDPSPPFQPNPFENPVEVSRQPSNSLTITTVSMTPSLPPSLKAPVKRILPTPVETTSETSLIFEAEARRLSPQAPSRAPRKANSPKKRLSSESEKNRRKSEKINSKSKERLSLLKGDDLSNISDSFWTPVKEKEPSVPMTPRVILSQRTIDSEDSSSLEEGEIRLNYDISQFHLSSCNIDGPPITPGRRSPTSSFSNSKDEQDGRVLKEQTFNGILAKGHASNQHPNERAVKDVGGERADKSREYNFQVGGKKKILTFTEHESIIGLLEMSKSPLPPSSPKTENDGELNLERKKALAICSTIDMKDFQDFINSSQLYPN